LQLEDAGERIDVPDVVFDHQDPLGLELTVAVHGLGEHALLFVRQVGHELMQEERDLVEQTFRRACTFDDD
jgi:hypothetical protein